GSTSTARFKVTLDRPAKQTVSVDYATSDGTARAGQDYDAASGTLTFAPGETAKTIDVRVRGDVATENNETFFVTLRNAAGATLLKGEASAVIDDDDQFADVGVVLSSSIDAFGSIQDPVTVSNKGPTTATDLGVKFTTTPDTIYSCYACTISQLGSGGSA